MHPVIVAKRQRAPAVPIIDAANTEDRMLANDILHTIGNTPHIRVNRLFGNTHSVYVKSERSNPGGSI